MCQCKHQYRSVNGGTDLHLLLISLLVLCIPMRGDSCLYTVDLHSNYETVYIHTFRVTFGENMPHKIFSSNYHIDVQNITIDGSK